VIEFRFFLANDILVSIARSLARMQIPSFRWQSPRPSEFHNATPLIPMAVAQASGMILFMKLLEISPPKYSGKFGKSLAPLDFLGIMKR
jgi:hypothetical protein